MNDIQHITTERVDDIPLLLEQMKQMELPTLIDRYFPAHGNWYGLSMGWISTIWLSSIVSRGDHRLSHVEPWVDNRLETLSRVADQDIESLDFTDDRLEIVLRHLSTDSQWETFENHLNQHTVRVYDLSTERVHVDSTTASAYTQNWRGCHPILSRLFDFVPLPLPFLLNSSHLILDQCFRKLLLELKQAPALARSLITPIEMNE